jgi:signal transduction histidine kinase
MNPLENDYKAFLQKINLERARVGAILAASLVMIFSLLDFFSYPEYAKTFLFLRVADSALLLIALAISYSKFGLSYGRALGIFEMSLTGIMINIMIRYAGYETPYYAGLNLVVLAIGVLFPWSLKETILTSGFVYICYLAPILLFDKISNIVLFVNNNIFLLATIIIASIASYFASSIRRREFDGRYQLEKAGEALKKSNEKLQEYDKAKTRFFANISHEFRTPLTLMLGPIEDALYDQEDPLSIKQHVRLDMAQRNTLRLQRLVNNLLDFTRIEAGRMEAQFTPTDLCLFTKELCSVFRSAFEKAGIEFIINCQPLHTPAVVDRTLWEKLVFNLLSNALKFTFKGKVEVILFEEKETIVFQVMDTGEGIPQEELPNLFKRFHRIQGAKARTYEGSGIGLALVQELVKLHGGTIQAESQIKTGTTFTVRIPCGSAHLPQEQIVTDLYTRISKSNTFVEESLHWLENETTQVNEDTHDIDKALLLIVDDNADMREYVKRILQENSNWRIETASNGLSALESIKKQIPDLVLSDIMMPEMDGFELLQHLRSNENTARIPVILLSARAGEEATIEGLERGADDYLIKPFSARELFARVKTHLEMSHVRKNNAELMKAKHDLELTNEELGQFAYVASHDLQEPLTTISNFVGLLEEQFAGKTDENTERYLHFIITATSKMRKLIRDLLAFSIIGRNVLFEEVYCNTILKEVMEGMGASIQESHAQITSASLPVLKGSALHLHQLFQNLMSNAIKFRNKDVHPQIEIAVEEKETEYLFSIKDNGIGIEEEFKDNLFIIFQRLHTTSEYPGTGIGLATCKKIVKLHNGKIWVESIFGEESTFYFTISKKI